MRRRYTKQDKLAVVADAEVLGGDAAAEKHGVPRSTLQYWLNDPKFAEVRSKTREDLAEGFRVLAHLAQTQLASRIAEMEPRDLTILLGVSIDKTLLMSGDATSRSEVSTFHGYNDHEKRAIADLLRKALADDGTEAAPAGDAGGDAVVGAGTEGTTSS